MNFCKKLKKARLKLARWYTKIKVIKQGENKW